MPSELITKGFWVRVPRYEGFHVVSSGLSTGGFWVLVQGTRGTGAHMLITFCSALCMISFYRMVSVPELTPTKDLLRSSRQCQARTTTPRAGSRSSTTNRGRWGRQCNWRSTFIFRVSKLQRLLDRDLTLKVDFRFPFSSGREEEEDVCVCVCVRVCVCACVRA